MELWTARKAFQLMFIGAAGSMVSWDLLGMYLCSGLPMVGLHVCASIVHL